MRPNPGQGASLRHQQHQRHARQHSGVVPVMYSYTPYSADSIRTPPRWWLRRGDGLSAQQDHRDHGAA